jgi:hypothetical protein
MTWTNLRNNGILLKLCTDHLLLNISSALRESQRCSDVSGTDEKLRAVIVHERSVAST